MWKLVLSIALLLIFSFGLGWAIQQDPGYVLVTYHNWSIETSLWFAVAAILVLSLAGYWSYKLIKHSIILPTHITRWSLKRKQTVADLESDYGFCELLEARWDKAERKLVKSIKHVANPFTNYLGAAYLAQQQKNYTARDEYLRQAQSSLPGSELAVELLKARLQIEADQSILALHGLQNLIQLNPKHPAVLNLLHKLYLQTGEWPALVNLLPAIGKYSALNENELKDLSLTVYSGLLKQVMAKQDACLVEQAWLAVPNAWKANPELLGLYVTFYSQDISEAVLKLLEDNLKKNWNENLVRLYGLVKTKNPAKQLKLAESWLKQHPRDSELLSCLGRLSARDQLWGKAQEYFSASLGISPKASTYWELAKIQEQLKRVDAAQESYKKGLEISADLNL